MPSRLLSLVGILLLSTPPSLFAQPAKLNKEEQLALAKEAQEVVRQHCVRCHGGQYTKGGFNITLDKNLREFNDGDGDDKRRFLEPGNPEKSQIWYKIEGDKTMPPPNSAEAKGFDDAKKQVIKKWIESAGASDAPTHERKPITTEQMLGSIVNHLARQKPEDQPYLRYFTLCHLHNHPKVSDKELRYYRAALAKLCNSLSTRADIYVPKAIDPENTVFVIDVRNYGWEGGNGRPDLWSELLSYYPYGVKHDQVKGNNVLKALEQQLQNAVPDVLIYVRADWFINEASQPPLYHEMLRLPHTIQEVEADIGVEPERDFLNDRLIRVGVINSGVSRQNRIMDRHEPTKSAYYWKSYDFASVGPNRNIMRYPLGPVSNTPAMAKYQEAAFKHAGGEMIWSLQNGMQAYLLTDNKGNRINRGPIDIVLDTAAISGTPEVVNGLSCMNCHRYGIIDDFKDKDNMLRNVGVFGGFGQKIENIVPEQEVLKLKLKKDKARFMAAVEECIGSIMLSGDDKKADLFKLLNAREPVGDMARQYQKDLLLIDAASELMISEAALKVRIENSPRLQSLGLLALLDPNGGYRRSDWEDSGDNRSVYQTVLNEMKLARPMGALKNNRYKKVELNK